MGWMDFAKGLSPSLPSQEEEDREEAGEREEEKERKGGDGAVGSSLESEWLQFGIPLKRRHCGLLVGGPGTQAPLKSAPQR